MHSKAIDSDTLYDIPDDDPVDLPLTLEKKDTPSQLASSHPIASNNVLLCAGKGAFNFEKKNLNVDHVAKRRKTSTHGNMQCILPMTKMSTPIDERSVDRSNHTRDIHLTTPSETITNPRQRAGTNVRGSHDKIDLIEMITKPGQRLPSKSSNEDKTHTKSVSNHQVRETTEKLLRLSQTTIDKLSSFRHDPWYIDSSAEPGNRTTRL